MSEVELRSCPICGRDVCIGTEDCDTEILNAVICDYCNLRFYGSFSTKEELIKEWNTRKPMERIIGRLGASKLGAKDSKDLSKYSAYEQAIEIVREEGGIYN